MASTSGLKAHNILLVGATGLIGKHILNAVINNREQFGRIAILTSAPSTDSKRDALESLKGKGVDVIFGDIRNEQDVTAAYEGIDTVVSALGRGALAEQIPLIQLADKSPSVKWFLPSEYGTDIEYAPESVNEKPHQQKLKVRSLLKTVKDLSYTYVVTGPFAELYIGLGIPSRRGGSFNVTDKKADLLGDGNGKISLTAMPDVGKLALAALLHPEVSKNRALKVNSFTTTPAEVLAEFERQTGGSKWGVTYTPVDELRALEADAWTKSLPQATFYTLRRIWTEGGTLYDKRDNELIEAPPTETLQNLVKQAVETS